jgi:hypothetical protein
MKGSELTSKSNQFLPKPNTLRSYRLCEGLILYLPLPLVQGVYCINVHNGTALLLHKFVIVFQKRLFFLDFNLKLIFNASIF